MSLLPPHAIDEFQRLWKQRYGVDLSRQEATARAHQLFSLVHLIVQSPVSSTEVAPPSAPKIEDVALDPCLEIHFQTPNLLSDDSIPDSPTI